MRWAFGLVLMVFAGCANHKDAPAYPATENGAASALTDQLGAIKICWKKVEARLTSPTGQKVRFLINENGRALVRFVDDEHNKHPLGVCILKNLQDVRFAPPGKATEIILPVDFSERNPSEKATPAVPASQPATKASPTPATPAPEKTP